MSAAAIELSGVWHSFRRNRALEDVSLKLDHGQFLGVIGPNGAGKSVLLKVIAGLIVPERGTVSVYGRRPDQARGVVGYVPQYAGFDQSFPIRVLDVALMGRLAVRGPLSRFRGEDRAAAMQALERVQMAALADRQIGKLSGGQLQRVLVARALAVGAKLLLLDEPTASLDATGQRDLYSLLGDLKSEITVVLVTHDIGVMTQHVTSVACLNQRLFHHGSREISREVIEEAYGCPVDFIVHGHTHLHLDDHEHDHGQQS